MLKNKQLFSRQSLFPLLPCGFNWFVTTPPLLAAFREPDRFHILCNSWQLAQLWNLLPLCETGAQPSVPYHWNITCPLILVLIIKVQPAPHHMAHPEPRPAALLLLPTLTWVDQVKCTQHFAGSENQTRILAWLPEPGCTVLPKGSFLFAKWVSLRICWWFSLCLFLPWKLPRFSVLWSGCVQCLMMAVRTAATEHRGKHKIKNGCIFWQLLSKSLLEHFVPS